MQQTEEQESRQTNDDQDEQYQDDDEFALQSHDRIRERSSRKSIQLKTIAAPVAGFRADTASEVQTDAVWYSDPR